ncbi:hypothetical protein OXX80_007328 [Metschnikowia pulcherrima]
MSFDSQNMQVSSGEQPPFTNHAAPSENSANLAPNSTIGAANRTDMEPSTSTLSENDSAQAKARKRKKKVEMACVYCRRSHMICDDARPCSRCIKRGIGHLCHDEPASKMKKRGTDGSRAATPLDSQPQAARDSTSPVPILANPSVDSLRPEAQPPADMPLQNEKPNTQMRPIALNKSLPFNQEPFFYSEHAGSEFSSLNDFLSIIDDPELVNGALNDDAAAGDSLLPFSMNPDGNSGANFNSLLQFSPTTNTMGTFPDNGLGGSLRSDPQVLPQNNNHLHDAEASTQKVNPVAGVHDAKGQPMISDSARDKFFLTAADPTTEISPEERLKQVIKAKLEAGLLQPYNYAKGYARLQSYMDNFMNQSSRQRILKPLSIFRPAFRAIAKTLKDVDLVLVEESFERMLLDYDRVFTSMAIPACLWRRTGEIYRGNKEFASLVGVTTDDLKDGKLAIYELMSEESAVNFWEKYGAIAFDKGQKAVLTSCNLRTKDGRKRKSCCFSFTIRRDRYNIPSCIVGNFIPIDP